MKPFWRWWLFLLFFEIDSRTGWSWARAAWAWCIPANAFGEGGVCGDEVPF